MDEKQSRSTLDQSCPKTVLGFKGTGVCFQAHTICPEVVERPFDRLTVLSNVEGHHNSA